MDPLVNPLINPPLGTLTLAAADWVTGLLIVGFLACSVLLVLTVLIQRPQGGGLSGAFGGGGGAGGETAFGSRTGDALTIATISFFVLWLSVAVGLVLVMTPQTAPPPGTQAVSNEGPATPGENTDESGGGVDGGDGETGDNATDVLDGTPAETTEPTGEVNGDAGDSGAGTGEPAGDPTGGDTSGSNTEDPTGGDTGGG